MCAYEVVAVIITRLLPDTYLPFVVTCLARSLEKVLWKKLASLVEVVTSSLYVFRMSMRVTYVMKSVYDERSR